MSIDDVPEIDINCDGFQSVPETPEPDKSLANWERWMEERKRMHRKFERYLGRKPSKLLVNAAEDRKEFDEKRRNIDYAKIPKWDKYRGNPMGWMVPPMLAKRCPRDLEYRTTLTLQEQGFVPEIEYVKVPDVIKEEKETVCTRNAYDLNKSGYFAKKLNHLVPHRPEMREIMVIGKSLQYEDKVAEIEKQYSSNLVDEENFSSTKGIDYLLSLNNLQLFPNDTGIRNVKLFLEGSPNNVEFLHLEIHNNSDKAIRFVLQKNSKRRALGKVTSETHDDLFFWNKNIHVLQPAEKIDFCIYFKSKACGSFTHTLQMLTKPTLFDSLTILIFIQVNIIKQGLEMWCWNITMYLENQIRNRMISETLDAALQKVPRKKSDVIMYSYDKASIFEAVNAFYSNNNFCLRYVYDKNVVDELEKFYETVRLDRHPELWDYRIETLRTVTRHRVNYITAFKLQDDLEKLRIQVVECNAKREKLELQVKSFWGDQKVKSKDGEKKSENAKAAKKDKIKDGDGKDKKKGGSVKLVERPRPPLPKTISDDLEVIISNLRSPTTWKLEFSRKIQICYTLFCAYIDKICAECKELELMFGIIKVNPKVLEKIYVEYNRIYDEKLDESNMQYPRVMEFNMSFNDKPAPPWCSTIPLDNYEERYKAFKAEKVVPSVRSSTKSSPRKTLPVLEVEEDQELEEMYVEEEENVPPQIYSHYKNNMYIVFNRNLWMLVDDMLAAFELVPNPTLKLDVLRQARLNTKEDLGEDEGEVRIFDLKKTISDVLKETEIKEEAVCTCECVCELNQSLLNIFTTYQSKPCAVSKETDEVIAIAEAARVRAEEFHDVAVMTTPSIDIPPVMLDDDGGVCGPIKEDDDESVECICKNKSWKSTFHYYNSVIGFDVKPDGSSSDVEHSCKAE